MQSHRERVEEFLRGGRRTQEDIQRAHIAAIVAVDDTLRLILKALESQVELMSGVDLDMPK